MQEITLGRQILVQRHLVALVAIPVLCCITFVAWGAVTIANMEFSYAAGISDNMYPHAITGQYRLAYNYWWTGPIVTATWAFILVCRKRCSLMTLICYVQFAIVFVTVWAVFSMCAFYFANQSFWGWRRVIVDHEVYADKGFWPGQESLVPGGDSLLPGELYDGKWGTPGAISVLRNVVGTSQAKKWTEESTALETPPNPDLPRVREHERASASTSSD